MLHRGLKLSALNALCVLESVGLNEPVTFRHLQLLADDDVSTDEHRIERDANLAERVNVATGAQSTADAGAAVSVGQAPAVDYRQLAAELIRQTEEKEKERDAKASN